jgi:hypothetical protein
MKTNDININDNDENQTAMKITIITNNKLIWNNNINNNEII